MKKSVTGKVAAGAATAGLLGLLFYKTKDRLGPKPVNVSVELRSTDMNVLSESCRTEWNRQREAAVKEMDGKAERQTAALLMDCEESGMGLLGQVHPEAEVLSNQVTGSLFSRLVIFLLSPVISLLLALAATGFLVSIKWQMENSMAPEMAKLLNPVILLSAAVALHLLMNVIYTIVKNAPERSKRITVGVKLTIPAQSRELFMQTQLERVKEDAMQIQKTYAASSQTDESTLMLLSETYSDICQAEVTDDMTDIFGFIKPRCAMMLKKMNVDIVENYTAETAYLFTVIEAPGYGKSIVAKPALVHKNSGHVLTRGEYVKDI